MKPIIFSGEMVIAALDGRKSQTRRVIKPQPQIWKDDLLEWYTPRNTVIHTSREGLAAENPYGVPGDHLWVRETWAYVSHLYTSKKDPHTIDPNDKEMMAIYRAGWNKTAPKWKPSIFMPRWASRFGIVLKGVRVEQVQDISEEDALAEGVLPYKRHIHTIRSARDEFQTLWDEINGKRGFGWNINPWVWVLDFELG